MPHQSQRRLRTGRTTRAQGSRQAQSQLRTCQLVMSPVLALVLALLLELVLGQGQELVPVPVLVLELVQICQIRLPHPRLLSQLPVKAMMRRRWRPLWSPLLNLHWPWVL